MRAMLLAAGYGERMRPLTLRTPKPALPVLGLPLVRHVVRGLAECGVDRVVVNLHHLPEAMRASVEEAAGACRIRDVRFTHEPEILGTGGGLRHAAAHLRGNGTILVRNADFLADVPLDGVLEAHRRSGCPATLVLAPARPGYSVVETGADGRILSLAGEPRVDPARVAGRHLFTGWQLVEEEVLERLPPGRSDTVRDLYRTLAAEGRLQGWVHDGAWIELGTPRQFLAGVLDLLSLPAEVRARLLDPGADRVREIGGARVARPEEDGLDPGGVRGAVALGRGTVVEAGCALDDVVTMEDVLVGRGSRLRRVLLAPGTILAAGTELAEVAAGPWRASDGTPPAGVHLRDGLWLRPLAENG